MKSVPIKELKENLAHWAEEAAHGELVQITKYNHPYIILSPSKMAGVYQGSKVGKESLKSVLQEGTQGKWLKYLQEDRDERS